MRVILIILSFISLGCSVLFFNYNRHLTVPFQILGYCLLITFLELKHYEKYYPDYEKDYESALRIGYVVGGGSVYARDPEVNYPGLGWVL